jgi:hypothetical protein
MTKKYLAISLLTVAALTSACTQKTTPVTPEATPVTESMMQYTPEPAEAESAPVVTLAPIPTISANTDAQTKKDVNELDAMLNKADKSDTTDSGLNDL